MSADGWSRFSGREYMVRGRGYLHSLDDIGNIVLLIQRRRPARRCACAIVATVTFGPDMRRGVGDLDGRAKPSAASSSCACGENAQKVIERVKAADHADLSPPFPRG